MDVISTVIERKVVDVQIRGNEVPVMDVDEKNERFDVNCTIDAGDQINVEMHCFRQEELNSGHENFINKYVYFLTDLHSSQKSKGKLYRNLAKTYQITFCMYNIFPLLPDYVNNFSLRKDNGYPLTDQINIIIIELDKINRMLNKHVDEMTSFEKWSLFFRFAQESTHRTLINDIIKSKEEISMAAELLQEISQDEDERARLRSRKKYEMDMYTFYHSAIEDGLAKGMADGMAQGMAQGLAKGMADGMAQGMAQGIAEGIEQGIEQGKAEEKLAVARNALAEGYSIESIQKITGLSLEEIKKL